MISICRSQVYKLVQDLHRIGIRHGDLEPRNIGRARGGGFCLIDFSESRRHSNCNKSKRTGHSSHSNPKSVFRTTGIAKLLVETTAPAPIITRSSPSAPLLCRFGRTTLNYSRLTVATRTH
ncbi:hypothetical protein JOM56_011417 [Amanita muscaria]